VVTVRDVTQRKKMEFLLEEEKRRVEDLYGQLQAAFEKLKVTQEVLISREKFAATGELAAAVAHEIRNPLSIISMSVQHIHSKLDPNDPLRECAQVVIQKIERLNNLTKQLIHYSRPQQVNLKSANLHRTLDSTLRLAMAKCAYKKVEIIHHYDLALPLIQMDEEQMDEVFINIIENALDAMPNGGKLLITTHLDPGGERVIIQFSNNGKGIPPRHRHRIFEPFFTTKKGGTGLGLAICQRIVNYHGGRISCESKISGKRKGTTFTITLPISPQGPVSEVPTK
jgi:signal transduction histidine kinase